MRCPGCSAINRERARFCAQCGIALPAIESGLGSTSKERFCDLCGEPLRGEGDHVCLAGRPLNGFFPVARTVPIDGERKQVTVLFADISGSTQLIAGLDPEQAWALLDPVLQIMIRAVVFYGGTVNQIQGDGIMALVGAPRALEDHALRGCYAALLMHQMVGQEFGAGSHGIHLHIGIATGEALVGTIGSDFNQCYNAMGEIIHLAARLQGMAEPGQTLCAGETLRQAGGFIASGSLRTVEVRGIGAPIQVGELLSATDKRSRFDPSAPGGLTSRIDREAELLKIQECSDLAFRGVGQALALVGEAGVGKSRRIWEQMRSLRLGNWQIFGIWWIAVLQHRALSTCRQAAAAVFPHRGHRRCPIEPHESLNQIDGARR
jgi:class 3 adenylate cyclase